MFENIRIEINGKLTPSELNNLLKTNNWELSSHKQIKTLLKRSWCYIIARDRKNKLIGFVHVLSDDIMHAYILRLIVDPEYQNHGIGTKIMKELLIILDRNQLKPTLVATPGNAGFYEKFGFKTEIKGLTAMCIR